MPEVCQFLDWDSRFFDLRIARLQEPRLDEDVSQAALDWCRGNRIDCLYYLADAADQTSIQLAEQLNFNFVDIRLTLGRALTGFSPPEDTPGSLVVRPWRPDDLPALQAIASSGFGATRFYSDTNFPRQAVDDLYPTWIANSCHGYAQEVLVALPGEITTPDPIGFITAHLDPSAGGEGHAHGRYGRIGLLGIDPAARRQGVGQILIEHSLAWFAEHEVSQVSVVTQGRNVPAQRLYQRCGFLTQTVQLWYHRWFR